MPTRSTPAPETPASQSAWTPARRPSNRKKERDPIGAPPPLTAPMRTAAVNAQNPARPDRPAARHQRAPFPDTTLFRLPIGTMPDLSRERSPSCELLIAIDRASGGTSQRGAASSARAPFSHKQRSIRDFKLPKINANPQRPKSTDATKFRWRRSIP